MGKLYQLFLSSTFTDLKDARAQLLVGLSRMGQVMPVGMELFPASGSKPWEHIENVIRLSDYYLLIVAGRYGTISEGISYTEKEYLLARQLGKHVIAFIHEDIESLEHRDNDLSNQKRFIQTISSGQMPQYWKTIPELVQKAIVSVHEAIRISPSDGWVRGSEVTNQAEFLSLKADKIELERKLVELEKKNEFIDISEVASGEDRTNLHYKLHTGTVHENKTLETTWNKLISILGPNLFSPLGRYEIEKNIEQIILNEIGTSSFTCDGKDATRILMQFYALGLIDTNDAELDDFGISKWKLTSDGRRHVAIVASEKKIK